METATEKTEVIGESLATARRLRRMKQIELAERVGSPRPTIASLERRDRSVVELDLVLALEHELGAPRGFLGVPPAERPNLERIHYRKKASATLKDREFLADLGGQMARLLDYLLARCKVAAPRVGPKSGIDPEVAAEEVRRILGLRLDAPINNMVQVVEVAGVFVGTFVGDLGVDGFSWVHGGHMMAMIRGDSSTSRARWSLAHELGHVVLGHGVPANEDERDRNEDAANKFASALLLPRVGMWREFPRERKTIDWTSLIAMKRRWGASLQAILYRARDLGLLDPSQYRRSQVRISQKGWRKDEPGEPPKETPRFLPKLIEGVSLSSTRTLDDLAGEAWVLVDLIPVLAGRPLSMHEPTAEVVSLALERRRRAT